MFRGIDLVEVDDWSSRWTNAPYGKQVVSTQEAASLRRYATALSLSAGLPRHSPLRRAARSASGDLDPDHLISGLHATGCLFLRRLFHLAYRPMAVCPLACLLWRAPNLEESEMFDVQFGGLSFQLLKPSPERALRSSKWARVSRASSRTRKSTSQVANGIKAQATKNHNTLSSCAITCPLLGRDHAWTAVTEYPVPALVKVLRTLVLVQAWIIR